MSTEAELNEIGVLKRREIEARILAPILEALGNELGRERVLEITRNVVIEAAQRQGREVAQQLGKNDISSYAGALEPWTRSGSLQLRILRQDEQSLHFDVEVCRYAELYRELGIVELGEILSCNRDAAFIEGFNPEIGLERTQTIMQGAKTCDFRYRTLKVPPSKEP